MNSPTHNIAVVKLGTALVTHDDNNLNTDAIAAYVAQIMQPAIRNHYRVILVTSGAIAAGKALLNGNGSKDPPPEGKLQQYASIGQPHLLRAYDDALRQHGALASQVLLTNRELRDATAREKILATLRWNIDETRRLIVPVVNENDTVATDEFVTDNDQIAGQVAELVHAQALVLFTDKNGVLADIDDPRSTIHTYAPGSRAWEQVIRDGRKGRSRGGMASKCDVGARLSAAGIRVHIADGRNPQERPDLLERILLQPGSEGTTFEAAP